MKGRWLFGLLVSLELFGASSLTVLASTVAQSRQTIQSLADGDYLYGKVSYPNKIGGNYVVFRKSGNVIIGLEYTRNTDNSFCFKGQVNSNAITDVTGVETIVNPPAPIQYKFFIGKTFDMSKFYRVSGVDEEVNAMTAIRRCEQLLANKPKPGTPKQND